MHRPTAFSTRFFALSWVSVTVTRTALQMKLCAILACAGLVAAQVPSITRNGANVNVVTGNGGTLQVNGIPAATSVSP